MQLITINEAANLLGKSIQTIRRMIKQKKIEVRKQRTPQGFNYLIVKESLRESLTMAGVSSTTDAPSFINAEVREHRNIDENESSTSQMNFEDTFRDQLEQFGSTIQKLIEQNQQDKSNFFQLIKTFQDRNSLLEDRIKQLEAPRPAKWKFWK